MITKIPPADSSIFRTWIQLQQYPRINKNEKLILKQRGKIQPWNNQPTTAYQSPCVVSIQIVLKPKADLHFRQRPMFKRNDKTGIFSNHWSWWPQEKQKDLTGLKKFRDWSWMCCFRKEDTSGDSNKRKRFSSSANCSGKRSRKTFTKLPVIKPSRAQKPISKYCTHAPDKTRL